MDKLLIVGVVVLVVVTVFIFNGMASEDKMETTESQAENIYSFKADTLMDGELDFASLEGKVLLIANTASKCGFTKQYADLQQLHDEYGDKGLVVIGFPCNQFLGQEPGNSDQIAEFCQKNYGVEFQMMSKIEVKGKNQHPVFAWLTSIESDPGKVKWNFEKFLVGRDGKLIDRYRSKVKPSSPKVVESIEKALAVEG